MNYYRIGEKNGNIYTAGKSWEGWVYKDEEAFKTGVGICYIPECAFKDKDTLELNDTNRLDCYTREDLRNVVIAEIKERGDLDKFSEADIERAVEGLFEDLDWTYPETLVYEMEFEYNV